MGTALSSSFFYLLSLNRFSSQSHKLLHVNNFGELIIKKSKCMHVYLVVVNFGVVEVVAPGILEAAQAYSYFD
jgi:hypothetical protein